MVSLLPVSIRNQIVLLIVLMTLMPLCIVGYSTYKQQEHDIEDAVELTSSVASQIENDQDILLAGAEQLAATVTNLPMVKQRDANAVNALLSKLVASNPRLINIVILDRNGSLWASGRPPGETTQYADRRYFRNAITTGRAASGEYTVSRATQRPVISFGYPVRSQAGEITDVMAVVFPLEAYNKFYGNKIAAPVSSVLITDHRGTILYSSVDKNLAGKPDRSNLFRKMADGPAAGTFEGDGNLGTRRIFSYRKLTMKGESSPYMYIRTGMTRDAVLAKSRTDLLRSAEALLFAMLLLLCLAVFLFKRQVIDRISALLGATRRIAAGDLSVRVSTSPEQNELCMLGQAFNSMTERLHAAHSAQRESEEKYRELVENAGSIILKCDNNGNISYFNEYAEKFFGYTKEEIIGKSVIGTIVPETDSSGRNLTDMVRKVFIAPETFVNNENENIRRNGERVWISWNNHALIAPDGSKAGILSVGQDITERKRIETELQQSEQRFRAYVESANDVVFALSPEGIFTYVSPKWGEAFGYEIEETVGKPFTLFVHPDDLKGCFDFLQLVLETGVKQSGVEYRVLCKDGTYLWYKANGALIKDPTTGSVSFIGIGRDITERKQYEETMRQSEEKFSSVFHASPDAIVLSHLNGSLILDVNEGFTRMTGFAAGQVIGKTAREIDLWQDYSDREKLESVVKKHHEIKFFEAYFKTSTGSSLLVQMSARVIDIDGTPCLLSIIRDITERDYILNELIKAQKLESISTLAGGIAHNFNNVITGVIGYISYAKRHASDEAKVLHILDSAEKSSYRAAGIARQLLTFSQAGPPARKPVPVDTLVRESVSLFLSGSNIKGVIECDSNQMVAVDSHQISQAFNNIVLNAVHAMPDHGTLSVRVTKTTLFDSNRYSLPAGEYVSIVFGDSGCGIRRDDLSKVFDPYFTTRDSGTGLGLSTTHSIIVKHDGHIDIASEVGKGTTVTILLPALTQEQLRDENINDVINRLAVDSILVVDHEELMRDFIKDILNGLGYKVAACSSGEEAWQLYRDAKEKGIAHSVVIVDSSTPDITGAETARRILAIDPDACLIAASSNPDDPSIVDFRAFGFSSAITKPYRSGELLEALHDALKSRAA